MTYMLEVMVVEGRHLMSILQGRVTQCYGFLYQILGISMGNVKSRIGSIPENACPSDHKECCP